MEYTHCTANWRREGNGVCVYVSTAVQRRIGTDIGTSSINIELNNRIVSLETTTQRTIQLIPKGTADGYLVNTSLSRLHRSLLCNKKIKIVLAYRLCQRLGCSCETHQLKLQSIHNQYYHHQFTLTHFSHCKTPKKRRNVTESRFGTSIRRQRQDITIKIEKKRK